MFYIRLTIKIFISILPNSHRTLQNMEKDYFFQNLKICIYSDTVSHLVKYIYSETENTKKILWCEHNHHRFIFRYLHINDIWNKKLMIPYPFKLTILLGVVHCYIVNNECRIQSIWTAHLTYIYSGWIDIHVGHLLVFFSGSPCII